MPFMVYYNSHVTASSLRANSDWIKMDIYESIAARKNTTYKMRDVESHFQKALNAVFAEKRHKSVEFVLKEMKKVKSRHL